MTPVTRKAGPQDNVRIGHAHMVHRRHPTDPRQTVCEVVHPLTHAYLTPTAEQVSCPRCLHTGYGRAA